MVHHREIERARRCLSLLGFKPTSTELKCYETLNMRVSIAPYNFSVYKKNGLKYSCIAKTEDSTRLNKIIGDSVCW